MSNTLELIIECLPVADVPELILHFLIGDVSLDSLSSAVFDQVFTWRYSGERSEYNIILTFSCLDPEKFVLHSFFDEPCTLKDQFGLMRSKQVWYKNGRIHRDGDKPAVISDSGGKEWWLNGKRHRDYDLPAQIFNEMQVWWKNGVIHRDYDLPAKKFTNGSCQWWKNGTMHRDNDLPVLISSYGKLEWRKDGVLHRDNDLPAQIFADGTKKWWKNGLLVKQTFNSKKIDLR